MAAAARLCAAANNIRLTIIANASVDHIHDRHCYSNVHGIASLHKLPIDLHGCGTYEGRRAFREACFCDHGQSSRGSN